MQNTASALSFSHCSESLVPSYRSRLTHLFSHRSASFARCLDIRDKYIALSCQRLGDNPKDHDGTFQGFNPPDSGDINGVKPEVLQDNCEAVPDERPGEFPTWQIVPPPPPPHWHWTPAENGIRPEHKSDGTDDAIDGEASGSKGDRGVDSQVFKFEESEIPGEATERCDFGLNDEGVYEVWYEEGEEAGPSRLLNGWGQGEASVHESKDPAVVKKGKGKQRVSRVPSLKEYFTDLDFLLGVCSDGPAKSFAFRRLRYLSSKWSLYCLLNEYQELADMKAVPHR